MKSFIDDNDEIENDRTFYDDVLKEEYGKNIVDIQKIDVSNFHETSGEEIILIIII